MLKKTFLLWFAVVLAATSCGNQNRNSGDGTIVSIESVKLEKDTVRMNLGENLKLNISGYDANGKKQKIENENLNCIFEIQNNIIYDKAKDRISIPNEIEIKATVKYSDSIKDTCIIMLTNKRNNTGWFLGGVICGVICGGVVFAYLKKHLGKKKKTDSKPSELQKQLDALNKINDNIKCLETQYKALEAQYNKVLEAQNKALEVQNKALAQCKALETQNKELIQENIELGEKIEDYRYKPKPVIVIEKEKEVVIPETDNNIDSFSTLYSDAIVNGFFNKVCETPNEDTIYELRLQTEQTATFTIHASAYQLVAKHPEFLEGCEKQVLNDAQNVTIESEGTAQKQADGKWRVTKKLNAIIS